jgi:hypothetical protein
MSAAVQAAKARRGKREDVQSQKDEWFIQKVVENTNLALADRVAIATNWLRDKVVKNISKPVTKEVIGGITRVTERSLPGEFPRADTTNLLKTIIAEVKTEGGVTEGYVGTPVDYGVILELKMDRSFLVRTWNAERANIVRMITRKL